MKSIIFTTTTILGLMFAAAAVVPIYNYSVPLGENDTIMMYYDEPVSEAQWQAMEEADEKEHRDEAKSWEDDDDDDK